jgi:hypothetical protein
MRVDVAAAVLAETDDGRLLSDIYASVETLRKQGRPKAGEGKGDNIPFSHRGTSAAHLVARLKRDHPDIAARLAAGEFPAR